MREKQPKQKAYRLISEKASESSGNFVENFVENSLDKIWVIISRIARP